MKSNIALLASWMQNILILEQHIQMAILKIFESCSMKLEMLIRFKTLSEQRFTCF